MLNLKSFQKSFADEFSGPRAKRVMARIIEFHRIQASPGIEHAIKLVQSEAKAAGLSRLELHSYHVDGKSKWWTWKKPWYWYPKEAKLRLVSPKEATLARLVDMPCTLATYSSSTPPEGITAEVVDVGSGIRDSDYTVKDVKGKIILVSGVSDLGVRFASKLARDRGAIGYITDSIVEQLPLMTRVDVPDIVGFSSVSVQDDRDGFFGFSVNHKQMRMLKQLLATNECAQVHAKVDTFLGQGEIYVLTGVIEGTTKKDEEVLLIAHICHPAPSANDNASGSALILEIARTLCRLIRNARIPPPKRTIRFMWVPETLGTIAYLHDNPEWPNKVQAVLCCDMVGEDQQVCGGPLVVERTSDAVPSYVNALAEHFLREIPVGGQMYCGASPGLWKYQMIPFGGGSDNYPFVAGSWRVPSLYFGHWPDKFYHSSADTLDKVDPEELERVGLVVSAVTQVIANAGPSEATLLACETAEEGLRRLGHRANEILWNLHRLSSEEASRWPQVAGQMIREGIEALKVVLEVDMQAVDSVLRLAKGSEGVEELEAHVEQLKEMLKCRAAQLTELMFSTGESLAGPDITQAAYSQRELTKADREAQNLVPVKKWTGPLNITAIAEDLSWESTRWLRESMMEVPPTIATLLRNATMWVDGDRNLLQIAGRIGALNPQVPVDLEALIHFFMDLAHVGLVEFKSQGSA